MAQTKVQLLQPDLGDVIDFDASTLFVDGADNRIGIRNTDPQYELDVTGTVRATNFIGNISTGTIDDWIVHTGDTNTKFGFPTADEFEVHAGGGPRLRISSAGNIGINESSPQTDLHIGSVGKFRFERSDGTRYGELWNDNSFVELKASTDPIRINGQSYIRLDIADNEKVRITSTQVASFGNSSPPAWQDSNGYYNLQLGNAGYFRADTDASSNFLSFGLNAYRDSSGWKFIEDGRATQVSHQAGEIFFNVSNSGNAAGAITFVEAFRIASTGNVSVGNNPTVHSDNIFHVEDSGETNVKFEGDTTTLGARLQLQNNNTGAGALNQIDFNDAGGQSTSSIKGFNTDQTNNYGELAFFTRDAQGSPPAERVRITKDGLLHISDRNSSNAGEHILQGGSFGIRMEDTGGYNRWNIERNYGGWQSTPIVHLSAQGRVGINQASPGCALNVKAIGSASDGLQVTSSSHSSYVWQLQNNDNLFNGSLAGELGIRGSSGISFSANAGTSTQFRITSAGQVRLPANGQELAWGASQQFRISWDNGEERAYLTGVGAYGLAIRVNGGNRLEVNKTTGDVTMQGASGRNFNWDNSDASLYLTDNGSGSSARLKIGSGADLQLYHDVSGMNHITCANNHELKLSALKFSVYDYTGGTQRLTIEDTHPTFILGNATSKSFQVRKNGTLNTASLQCIASFWHSGGTTSSDKRYIGISSSPDGVYGCHVGSYNDGTNPGWLQPGFYVATGHNSYLPNDHSIRFKISSNGNFYGSSTTISSISDARLKKNITNYTYDLNKFKQLQPKTFEWINPAEHCDDVKRGFSAQEVEAVDDYWILEDRVDKDSKDKDLLDSDRIAKNSKLGELDAMYVSVINQLIAKIETLETKVAALEGS